MTTHNLSDYRGPSPGYFTPPEPAPFDIREWLDARERQLDAMTWADLSEELCEVEETLQAAIRQHEYAKIGRIVVLVREAYAARLADRECDLVAKHLTAQQAANLACIGAGELS